MYGGCLRILECLKGVVVVVVVCFLCGRWGGVSVFGGSLLLPSLASLSVAALPIILGCVWDFFECKGVCVL
jgi:hypothetical protein